MPRTTPNGHAAVDLAVFRIPPKYEWLEFDREEANEGLFTPLRARVRVNPTYAEVQEETALFRALGEAELAAREHAGEAKYAQREAAARANYLTYLAPWVAEWNVQAERQDTGELAGVPAPADVGPGAFELLPSRTLTWLCLTIRGAYLGGELRSKLSRRPAPTASTSDSATPPATEG